MPDFVNNQHSIAGFNTEHAISSTPSGVTYGSLYETQNDRHDMTLRQVGYLKNYALSNDTTSIGISVINYTTSLGGIYDMFAPAVMNDVTVNTSQLPPVTKIAVDYLLEQGYNAQSASAIVGCLSVYSNIDPAFVTKKGSKDYLYGIGAWTANKMNEAKSRADGRDWNQDLTAQLMYLHYDLYTNYQTILLVLTTQALDVAGATYGAEVLMSYYNPYYADKEHISLAIDSAKSIYDQLIITQGTVIGGTGVYLDINGNRLSVQYVVPIPSSVQQTGIIDDYTSYSAWFPTNTKVKNHWGKGTDSRKLAELWAQMGFPSDKGIATVGGYYCVAVKEYKFGDVGDAIEVMLEDGTTFPAIIADVKAAGSNEWGHPYPKNSLTTSIVEWERVKTRNGVVVVDGVSYTDVDDPGFGDWMGKKVLQITNYGKFVNL